MGGLTGSLGRRAPRPATWSPSGTSAAAPGWTGGASRSRAQASDLHAATIARSRAAAASTAPTPDTDLGAAATAVAAVASAGLGEGGAPGERPEGPAEAGPAGPDADGPPPLAIVVEGVGEDRQRARVDARSADAH